MYGQQDDIGYMFLQHLAKTNYGMKRIQDEVLNILPAGRIIFISQLSHIFVLCLDSST
jgi:hypothetical protein